ncbi:DUF6705 family protein [Oceanihabitans sediminis]|uniref:DUF6705 family protein n=1 Tax=Oceanihabitans sediminis TaxID=1812012 RepID=UPI003A8FDECD
MKHIIITLILACFFSNISIAQSPIYPSQDWSDEQTNAYYKDLDNEINAFEGTWLYTNGNTSLKMVLEKQEMYFNGKYYKDIIIGEYQYIENGVELINTLDDLSLDLGYSHKIKGSSFVKTCIYVSVSDCIEGEVVLKISIRDAITGHHFGQTQLIKRTIDGQETLKAFMAFNYYGDYDETGIAPSPTMPWQQEYTFIKQ